QDTGLTFVWKNNGTTIPLASAYFLEVSETGVYSVEVGRIGIAGCESITNEVAVTVYPRPVVNITWDGEAFHATPGYETYQWYSAGQAIPGAADSTFVPSEHGGYSVQVT